MKTTMDSPGHTDSDVTRDLSEPLMTTSEVAKMLHVHVSTLNRWRESGDGPPAIRLGGKAVRYERRDVLAWVHQNRVA